MLKVTLDGCFHSYDLRVSEQSIHVRLTSWTGRAVVRHPLRHVMITGGFVDTPLFGLRYDSLRMINVTAVTPVAAVFFLVPLHVPF